MTNLRKHPFTMLQHVCRDNFNCSPTVDKCQDTQDAEPSGTLLI